MSLKTAAAHPTPNFISSRRAGPWRSLCFTPPPSLGYAPLLSHRSLTRPVAFYQWAVDW